MLRSLTTTVSDQAQTFQTIKDLSISIPRNMKLLKMLIYSSEIHILPLIIYLKRHKAT